MRELSRSQQIKGLIGWLVLAYLAAAIGAIASVDAAAFYETLQQPTWAPPAWLFGPMWTTLYGLMGIAAWLAWREPGARPALVMFVVGKNSKATDPKLVEKYFGKLGTREKVL